MEQFLVVEKTKLEMLADTLSDALKRSGVCYEDKSQVMEVASYAYENWYKKLPIIDADNVGLILDVIGELIVSAELRGQPEKIERIMERITVILSHFVTNRAKAE